MPGWQDGQLVSSGWQSGDIVSSAKPPMDPVINQTNAQLRADVAQVAVPKKALQDAQARQAQQDKNTQTITNRVPLIHAPGAANPNISQDQAALQNDQAAAKAQGASFNFSDELNSLGSAASAAIANATGQNSPGYSAGDAYNASQAVQAGRMADYAAQHPGDNFRNQLVGSVMNPANLVTAGVGPAANATGSVLRAGAMGAAQGAAYGAGAGSGLQDRGVNAMIQGGVGAVLSGGLQAGANALTPVVGNALNAASPARQLSREGVQLTPGQMTGGLGKTLEDLAQRAPIVGSAIKSARTTGQETFVRAAINRALSPIGESLPADTNVGRDAIGLAQQKIGAAYDAALSPVTVSPDTQFTQEVAQAGQNLPASAKAEFDSVIQDTIGQKFAGPINGKNLKEIDEELGAAASSATSRGHPTDRALARAFQATQDSLDGVLGRTDPKALAAKNAADEAYANFVRVQGAAASTGAKNGVFTPSQLSSSVRRADPTKRKGAFARGDALMQDLTDAGKDVLPDSFGNPGTADAISAMGLAGLVAEKPHIGIPVAGAVSAGALAYSKPVMALVNGVYRATDNQAAHIALGRLAQAAAQNPEARTAYSAVLAQLRGQGASKQQPQPQTLPATQ